MTSAHTQEGSFLYSLLAAETREELLQGQHYLLCADLYVESLSRLFFLKPCIGPSLNFHSVFLSLLIGQ